MSRGLKLSRPVRACHRRTPSRQLPMSRGLKHTDYESDIADAAPSRQLPMSRGLKLRTPVTSAIGMPPRQGNSR